MIRSSVIPWLLSLAALTAADRPDLLRFTNGDQLHGNFTGIKDGPAVAWQRDDLAAPVDFKTAGIRHIVLHGGRAIRPLESLSNIILVNGDRIPGTVTAINGDHITVDTAFAGLLRIPRPQVVMVAPNPLGGRVYYHGPFSQDDWKMTSPAFPDGIPLNPPADKEKKNPPDRWEHSGSAWYWMHKNPGTALIRETGMSERAVLSFNIAWKKRLSIAVAFHADFARTKKNDDEQDAKRQALAFENGDASILPQLFGNSYVLQLTSNYLILFRTSVSDAGEPDLERVQLSNNNLRLGETGRAKVEVRSTRGNGGITLFINDEFITQWNENDFINHDDKPIAAKGPGFGFVAQSTESALRISDIIVSEWNGMPDSARSLQMDEQDVILMANGTDRYSGRVGKLTDDGKLDFEGKHGSFKLPLNEVAEIRFATKQLASAAESPADNIIVRLKPIGNVSGRPIPGNGPLLGIASPIMGEMNLSMEAAVMLDFNASNHFIDDWDANF